MPDVSGIAGRHVLIDKRPGHYLSFPDVCLSESGRLIVVYRLADKHVAGHNMLLCKESQDFGQSFGPPRILNALDAHCPRISRFADGRIAVIDDGSKSLYWSLDHGANFMAAPYGGEQVGLPDRLLELGPSELLTTGHTHRGSYPHPKTRQPTSEQMLYRTTTQGRSFQAYSVIAYEPCLVLCEGSMIRLPDGRLIALMRENSFVYEPMYYCLSEDNGMTWGRPAPAALPGHRPTLGLTSSGKLLVTFRDVGPDPGTSAWLGSLEELGEYAVRGRAPSPDNPSFRPNGMLIKNSAGAQAPARYALRPITDPEQASARLKLKVKVSKAQKDGCGVHFGTWWRLFPDRIEPESEDVPPVAWEPGRFHELDFSYKPGKVSLSLDGRKIGSLKVDARSANTRPIIFGTLSPRERNAGKSLWQWISLEINEPRLGRRYRYAWNWRDGHPDAWARQRVLCLAKNREASFGDFGYSGWCELPDGRFYCVYHHCETGPDYRPDYSSHVQATWFGEDDFPE